MRAATVPCLACFVAMVAASGCTATTAAPLEFDGGLGWRLVIEPVDTEACADWAVAAHPQPELPADAPATPIVLWEVPAPDEGFPDWIGLTIAATGEVWMRGPTRTDITALSREGSVVFHHRAGDPGDRDAEFWSIHAAPDGTVFVVEGWPTPRALHQFSTSGLIGSVPISRSDSFALGPGGRLFLGDEYCRLRLMRRTRLEQWLPDELVYDGIDSFEQEWVTPAGVRVGFTWDLSSRLAIELDGMLSLRLGSLGADDPAQRVRGLLYASGATSGPHEIYSFGSLIDYTSAFRHVEGEVIRYEETYRSGDPAYFLLDPTGSVWRFDPTGIVRRLGHWGDRPSPCGSLEAPRDVVFADDGTLVCVDSDTGVMFALSPSDGAILWELHADPADETTRFQGLVGPDLDGRIYVVADPLRTRRVVAIQTNLRPAGDGYCDAAIGCNRHRNGWAHDYRPSP